MAEQREKFEAKLNLEYEVTLSFDEPKTGTNSRDDGSKSNWYLYGIVHEGVRKSWFVDDDGYAQIQALRVKKNDKLRVMREEDGKSKTWRISRADGKPSPENQNEKPKETPPEASKTNHVSGPVVPGPYDTPNGNGKRGWTRETIQAEVEFWNGLTLAELKRQHEAMLSGELVQVMPVDNICISYAIALRQRLYGPAPVDTQDTVSSQVSAVYELLDDSLILLGREPDPENIRAWLEKSAALLAMLPEDRKDVLRGIYKALPKS